jgi:hypothetical protein
MALRMTRSFLAAATIAGSFGPHPKRESAPIQNATILNPTLKELNKIAELKSIETEDIDSVVGHSRHQRAVSRYDRLVNVAAESINQKKRL